MRPGSDPLRIILGTRRFNGVPIRDIEATPITAGGASESIQDGISIKTSSKTWENARTGRLLIVKILTVTTARIIAGGAIILLRILTAALTNGAMKLGRLIVSKLRKFGKRSGKTERKKRLRAKSILRVLD